MSGDDLNPPQRAAVEYFEGPLLVLAGPGSGKTRVVTRRIARLVERGVEPSEILAITFTNKAANEMAERVDSLLPGTRVWVSTFHRFCARLLRKYAPAVGLFRNYSIFDTSDQKQLFRTIFADLNIDSHHYNPSSVAHRISEAKGEMLSAAEFAKAVTETSGDYFNRIVSDVYKEYERLLLEANAVDFDDLLMHVCRLLEESDEIRADLDRRFRFVLVDEYQDTNAAQYRIVRALTQDYPNVCVTGDPDQSIYRWRGADVGNILRFERDFPEAAVIRLEQNYRSTKGILKSADQRSRCSPTTRRGTRPSCSASGIRSKSRGAWPS
jgi:DNA helicase-2/ATP-dependent DNA helicase PcrA